MQVKSPVGTFPVQITSIRADRRGLRLATMMGAWQSEIRLDSEDLPLLGWGATALIAVFAIGRLSASNGRR